MATTTTASRAPKRHLFILTVQEGGSSAETERVNVRAYDADHACNRFLGLLESQGGNGGVTILSCHKVPTIRQFLKL